MTSGADTLAIRAAGLTRTFGEVLAVDHVDLAVERGAVFGLLGPDGAGKSTLIRMLATVILPDEGDAEVCGEPLVTSAKRIAGRIGYMSQRFSMYPDLTIAENLDFFATIRGVPRGLRRSRAASLLDSMGLTEFADRQARFLSGGMKQKLMLATTLMHEPELLLLDEPTTGVDPVSRREFWRIIASLHRADKTVFVATPYMDEAERCTKIAFMEDGRIQHTGTPDEIKALVPGTLLEVAAAEPRRALAALESMPGVASAHLYGEVVRALWAEAAENPALAAQRLLGELRRGGVSVSAVRPARIDMETAFAFLAERRAADGPAAGGPAAGNPGDARDAEVRAR